MQHGTYEHIAVDVAGNIATIEVRRGPNNFIDTDMVAEIADALEIYDRTPDVRAIVLCSGRQAFLRRRRFRQPRPRRRLPCRPNAAGIFTKRHSGFGVPASRSSPRVHGCRRGCRRSGSR